MSKKWITSTILKRVKKFLSYPTDLRYEDVKILLEDFGYKETTQQGGSHRVFVLETRREGVIYDTDEISVPTKKGRYVIRLYLKAIARNLHLEEWYEKHKKK